MKNLMLFKNKFLIVAISACLLLQPASAFAWDSHHRSSRHSSSHWDGHHSAWSYAGPLFGGLTFLALAASASQRREPETTVVVVPATTAADEELADTVVVNIPNSNGSYTRVVLRKSGNGYIGPQGEFYPTHPTVRQLRILYGK